MTAWNPNGGRYNPVLVNRLAREVVTEAMIDKAVNVDPHHGKSPKARARTRTNIAIGIACGSYPWPGR